jgi:hypothetical protein
MKGKYLNCRICNKKFDTGYFKKSTLLHYLKDYYMYRKIGHELIKHFHAEHKKEWVKYLWCKYYLDGLKGYSKAITKDLLLFPYNVIAFVWHVITGIFVCIDNTMWGDWL